MIPASRAPLLPKPGPPGPLGPTRPNRPSSLGFGGGVPAPVSQDTGADNRGREPSE
jgi:hypothetical protein